MEKLKEKIKEALQKKGWTQKKLIVEIEMSESGFINSVDRGSMKLSTLEKIAEALEVPISFFISDESLSTTKSKSDDFAEKLIQQYEKQLQKLERERSTLETNNQLLMKLVEKEFLGKLKECASTGRVLQVAA